MCSNLGMPLCTLTDVVAQERTHGSERKIFGDVHPIAQPLLNVSCCPSTHTDGVHDIITKNPTK